MENSKSVLACLFVIVVMWSVIVRVTAMEGNVRSLQDRYATPRAVAGVAVITEAQHGQLVTAHEQAVHVHAAWENENCRAAFGHWDEYFNFLSQRALQTGVAPEVDNDYRNLIAHCDTIYGIDHTEWGGFDRATSSAVIAANKLREVLGDDRRPSERMVALAVRTLEGRVCSDGSRCHGLPACSHAGGYCPDWMDDPGLVRRVWNGEAVIAAPHSYRAATPEPRIPPEPPFFSSMLLRCLGWLRWYRGKFLIWMGTLLMLAGFTWRNRWRYMVAGLRATRPEHFVDKKQGPYRQ